MKIPKVAFVKHCPKLSPERKVFLEGHLKERLPKIDIRWVEDYNHDDLFVQWINAKLNLPYGPKLTSNFVKSIFMMKQMIDENIECAFHIDDDAVFYRDWEKILNSIPEEIEQIGYINMGTSQFFNLPPKLGEVYQLPNNGGGEVCWVSGDFAKSFLNDLNMDEAPDIVVHGMLNSNKRPILNVPIAHQTSMIERISSVDHDTRKPSNWLAYVHNYTGLPKIDLNKLLTDFKLFEEKKRKLEDKFYELYGKRIDIKSVKYILNEDADHRVNIMDFKLIENKMNV